MSKQLQNSTNGIVTERKFSAFSGPIPHPDTLKRFNDIVPGAAERIIKMAEDQSSHRRSLEKSVIESDISRSKWGQILGFVIAIFGLTASTFIAVYGSAVAGSILGVGTLASLVGVFMYGSISRKKEREEKKD
jgi:uncharacterized membrane protein